jgi:hypothetical protein
MPNFDEPHAHENGFVRSVCEGCPHEGRVLKGVMEGCTICGCPFINLKHFRGGSPPERCPRLAEHREADPRHP